MATLLHACASRPLIPYEEPIIEQPQPSFSEVERSRFALRKDDSVIGELASVQIKDGDTLADIARHFGLGLDEISAANPDIDPWAPETGSQIILPLRFILPETPHKGIVINLAAMRMFSYRGKKDSGEVVTYPVGIGREGRQSPMGEMFIERKMAHPTWYVPESIRRDHEKKGDPLPAAVSPGPDNPLGDYALYLSRPSYLIHGTNKPYSIGLRASNGCIRLYPENIAELYRDAPVKTPIRIVNQPYLLGFMDGELYLEVHQPHEELNPRQLRANLFAKLKQIEKRAKRKLDWPKIENVMADMQGIPVPIFEHTDTIDEVIRKAVALSYPDELYGQPKLPPMTDSGWYIKAYETADEISAKKLAAMLNHQGPPIPARAVPSEGRYQVLAGPFKDAKTTKTAAKRMRVDLELQGRIISPTERLTLGER